MKKLLKLSKNNTIVITLDQAKEWDMEDERFCFVCDTYGIYAHQLYLIEKIERALSELLEEASCNAPQDSILEQNVYHHNYNG